MGSHGVDHPGTSSRTGIGLGHMRALREYVRRLWGSLRRHRAERDWEEELHLHLELAAEDAVLSCHFAVDERGAVHIAAKVSASIIIGAVFGLMACVLATGAGSLVLSHVNDSGFWLIKEFFNMTVPQTLKTWTVAETIIGVAGLAFTMLLGLVV